MASAGFERRNMTRHKASIFILLLLFVEFSFAQENNPTTYPYGGVQDSSRYFKEGFPKIALNFNRANFALTQFDSLANFAGAHFDSLDFSGAQFQSVANFEDTQFHGHAYFDLTQFDNLANFREAQFDSLAIFIGTEFHSVADFRGAQFDIRAIFFEANFDNSANFFEAQFDSSATFFGTVFNNQIDFRGAAFKSKFADFSLATIQDTVFIGNNFTAEIQKYDFLRAKLLPASTKTMPPDTTNKIPLNKITNSGAKLLLFGPVDLKIQLEKFKFLELSDTLDYYTKKDIISTLKDISFKDERFKKERFELDYILAKSTIYQKKSVNFAENSAWHPLTWLQFLYNSTMGLGYRPFRLVWWVLGLVIGFSIYYSIAMPEKINLYIVTEEPKEKDLKKRKPVAVEELKLSNTIINCFYFSAMVLFTFRLKRNILTFFDVRETRIIVTQWLIGFFIYIAFLTLSKSGSVLHTLKSLIG